jgi:hypothetical protein
MPRRTEPELRDLYADLGVTEDASQTDIKRSYRELVLKVHPDKQGDPAEFRKVSRSLKLSSEPPLTVILGTRGLRNPPRPRKAKAVR